MREEFDLEREFVKFAAELGLTPEQQGRIVGWFDDTIETQREALHDVDIEGLEGFEDARHVANALGLDEDQVGALFDALGPAATVEALAEVGRGEAFQALAGSGSPEQNHAVLEQVSRLDQDAAKKEIERLQNDPRFAKRYLDGDPAAMERMTLLHERAHGKAPVNGGEIDSGWSQPATPSTPKPPGSPEAAKEAIAARKADSAFMAKYSSGDEAATSEMNGLFQAAYPPNEAV